MKFVKSNLEPVNLMINGVEYPARLNFKALAELEELTQVGFMKFFDRFANGTFTVSDMLNLIFVSLKNGGVDIDRTDIFEIDFTQEFMTQTMMELTKLLNRTQKITSSIAESGKNSGADGKK